MFSLFTYGSEAWNLDERTCAAINGANSRCLSRITGRTIHEEANVRTRTYDLVAAIRRTRLRWLGHILRLKSHRILRLATIRQHQMKNEGNLFMDVPHYLSLDDIIEQAQDRRAWKDMIEERIPWLDNPIYNYDAPIKKEIKQPTRGRWIRTGFDAVWVEPIPTTPTALPIPTSTQPNTTINNHSNNNINRYKNPNAHNKHNM